MFRRRTVDPLSDRGWTTIRSNTRALIRLANLTETAGSRGVESDPGAGSEPVEWQAMTRAENLLAQSISVAVSRDVSIQAIVEEVIRPILRESVVLSELARASVLRAASMAERGFVE